jgi:hypothetical protein
MAVSPCVLRIRGIQRQPHSRCTESPSRNTVVASPDKKSFLLRIDPTLWAEIERLAAQELRSTNAQVEYLLRDSLARRGRDIAARPPPRPSATKETKR